MATYPRHKKARIIRDCMIETDIIKMFKEDEQENSIFFRTVYPMGEDRKQVVINVDDTIYLGVQTLLVENVPEEKSAEVKQLLNTFNLELPTVKYVLTKDLNIISSMFFIADEKHLDGRLVVGTVIQMMKTIADRHYSELKKILV